MIEPELLLNFLIGRRSIRQFEDKPVQEAHIGMILEAGRWAPSASNKQPWCFVIIKNREILREIAKKAYYGKFMKSAPCAIAIVGKIKQNPRWYVQDTTLASMNMMLMAWSLGIGCCWIGSMDREYAKQLLDLDQDDYLLTILPMGYLKGKIPKPTLRKPLDQIIKVID
jgi:nitroreductase